MMPCNQCAWMTSWPRQQTLYLATKTAFDARRELASPITESPLRSNPAQCSKTQHIIANRDDNCKVSMVPPESVLCSSTPPATPLPLMG